MSVCLCIRSHSPIKTARQTSRNFQYVLTVAVDTLCLLPVLWMTSSVLNILDSLLANQIPAKGVVTIVCRIEIRKMAEC